MEEEDANTRIFHLQACHRGRKNFIDELEHQGAAVVDEALKADLFFDHFDTIIGGSVDRQHGFDLHLLGLLVHNLSLDQCFWEEEVWSFIRALPTDKASGLTASRVTFTKQLG
jgi:hypothetical protein